MTSLRSTPRHILATRIASIRLAASAVLALAPLSAHSAILYWDGATNGTWATASNWDLAADGTGGDPGAAPTTGDSAFFNISTLNAARVIQLGASQAVDGITVANTDITTIQGTGAARILTLGAGGVTINSGTGVTTLSSSNMSVALGVNQTWTNGSTADLIASAVVSGLGIQLTKEGVGRLILTGANTFSGGLNVNAGTVTASTVGGFGTGAISLGASGTLAGRNTGGLTYTASSLTTADGSTLLSDRSASGVGIAYVFGNTALAAGTLNVSTTAAATSTFGRIDLGGAAGTVTLSGNAILNVTNGATALTDLRTRTITDGASSFSITKNGNGTLTLLSAGTFDGGVTLNTGTVALGDAAGAGTGTLTLVGGTLTSNSSGARILANTVTLDGNVTFGQPTASGGVNNGSGQLTFTGTTTLTDSRTITTDATVVFGATGTGDVVSTAGQLLTKSGAGMLSFNNTHRANFAGGIYVTAGTLDNNNNNATGASLTNLIFGTGLLRFAGGTSLEMINSPTHNNIQIDGVLTVVGGSGGGNNKRFFGNITGDGSLLFSYTGTTLGNAILSGASNTFTGGVTLTSPDSTVPAVTAASTNALGTGVVTLNHGSLIIAGNTSSGAAVGTTADQVIAGLVSANTATNVRGNSTATSTVTLNNTGTAIFAGTIGGVGTNQNKLAITKSGTGTQTFAGANTYIGATTISGGVLALTGGGALSGVTALDVSGATGVFDISAITAADTSIGSLAGIAGSSVVLGGKVLTAGGNDGSTTFDGIISGGAGSGLTKSGTGTLALTNANTYTGTTMLAGGFLNVGAVESAGVSGPLGTSAAANPGSIVMAGGGLQYSAANQNDYSGRFSTAASQAYSVDTNSQNVTWATALISTGGSLSKSGLGTLTLTPANTYDGTTTLSGGLLHLGSVETAGVSGPLGNSAASNPGSIVMNGGTLQYSAVNQNDYSGRFSTAPSQAYNVDTNSQNATWATALVSPSGTLHKSGLGALTLTAANTYDGTTTIADGLLVLSGSGALSGITALNVSGATGTFDISAITAGGTPIGSLAGVSGSSVVLGGKVLTAGGNGGTTIVDGIISGGAGSGLTKSGIGTMTLTNSNTYTGLTSIIGGVLSISSSPNLGNNSATNTIAIDGGTLQNTGAAVDLGVNRAVAIGAGGATVDVTGANDLTISGAVSGAGNMLTKTGSGTLNLNGAQTYTTLTTSAGVTNVTSSFTGGTSTVNANATTNFTVSQELNALNIGAGAVVTFGDGLPFAGGVEKFSAPAVMVPEPGTALSLLGGLAMLLGLRRVRRA